MSSSSTVIPLRQPDAIDDPLTAILRAGARRLLAEAVEAEAEAFLAEMKGVRLPDGRERIVVWATWTSDLTPDSGWQKLASLRPANAFRNMVVAS